MQSTLNNVTTTGSRRMRQYGVLLLGAIVVIVAGFVSLGIGATHFSFSELLKASVSPWAENTSTYIIWDMRMPRMLVAIMVGASMAVGGAVMQALTRNPLAGPSLAGLNAGGSLAVVIALLAVPGLSLGVGMAASMIGTCCGVGMVYSVARLSREGITPAGLALAGMIVSLFLSAVTTGLSHYFQTAFDLTFWTIGGLVNIQWHHVFWLAPVCGVSLLGTMAITPSLTLLSLGEDTAAGLGLSLKIIRPVSLALVMIMVGGAVAVAGPIGFVGLMVPHLARKLVGHDYRFVVPMSALLGAALLMLGDVLCRGLSKGALPVGTFTTALGGGFFLFLACRRSGGMEEMA